MGERERKVWHKVSQALAINRWTGWRVEMKNTDGFPDTVQFPPIVSPPLLPAFYELKALSETVPVGNLERFALNWSSPAQPLVLMSLALLGVPCGVIMRCGVLSYGVTDPKLRVWTLFRARPSTRWVQAVLKNATLNPEAEDLESVLPDEILIVKPGENEVEKLAEAMLRWYGWPQGPVGPPVVPSYAPWSLRTEQHTSAWTMIREWFAKAGPGAKAQKEAMRAQRRQSKMGAL